MGGVRREKSWAGGVLERAVVQVRAHQAGAGASGPLRHSRLCLTGAGVDGTIPAQAGSGQPAYRESGPRGTPGVQRAAAGRWVTGASAADLSGHHTDHRHPCTDGLITEFASSFSQKVL